MTLDDKGGEGTITHQGSGASGGSDWSPKLFQSDNRPSIMTMGDLAENPSPKYNPFAC